MKKTILIIAALLILATNFAQTPNISNPGFEQWNNSMPTNWTTNLSGNVIVDLMGFPIPIPINVNFGTQSTDAHSGNYALLLEPKTVGFSEYSYIFPGTGQLGAADEFEIESDVLLALINLDTANLDWDDIASLSTLTNLLAKGESFSEIPTKLKAWVKFTPDLEAKDSLFFVVAASQWNSDLNMREYVAAGNFSTGENISEYAQIEVPIFKASDSYVSCDSIYIIMLSSRFSDGTTTQLLVDDISFEFPNSVEDYSLETFAVAPNPAKNIITLYPNDLNNSYSIELFDISGKSLYKENFITGKKVFDVSSFSQGLYFIKMNQDNKISTQKVVIQ